MTFVLKNTLEEFHAKARSREEDKKFSGLPFAPSREILFQSIFKSIQSYQIALDQSFGSRLLKR